VSDRALRHAGRARTTIAVALLAFLASGCSVLGPREDTSRNFLLRAVEASGQPPLDDLVLGLGPVAVPDYMDRPEMLELVGPYELRYSDRYRWVEPLGTQLRRTLAEDLRALLRPDALVEHPWFETEGVSLAVAVTFDAVRLADDGAWRGSVSWVLRDASSAAPLERGASDFELGRGTVPPENVARGLSDEVGRLASEIADAVRRHHR
jgi:uncharacterized lipoprotein YmbA